ncbi:retrotransposon protein [Hordeum vulgare]|nr:retrotransposon protein [Hordeum vulgare]
MRDFFHLDNKVVNDVEDAVIDHGGEGALVMASAQDRFVTVFLGGNRLQNFAQRPAIGTRCGLLLLWEDDVLEVCDIAISTYSLSAMVRSRETGVCFRLTTVYGPNDHELKLFSKAKVQFHAANLVILHLDIAQEERLLSPEERDLLSGLKRRLISLAVFERARKSECARIANLRDDDANTKYFHRCINVRRRKNHIHRIKQGHGWVIEHKEKEKLIHDHFSQAMGKGTATYTDFNWEERGIVSHDLQSLDANITEDEVWEAIKEMPANKAPGPAGFTGTFFKKCWSVIKYTVMRVIQRFDSHHTIDLQWLNSANVILLPKKEGAEGIFDYRSISPIHTIAKIIAMVLSLRLAPLMDGLVSIS